MPTDDINHFLFSPSGTYPQPVACLIDRDAEIVHAWSNTTDQPDPSTRPPGYLRGWNHVELATDGSLYATVPLHSLLKLAPDSSLIWRAELPVHHDLDLTTSGQVYVLTERPRLLDLDGGPFVLLDNAITVLDDTGALVATHSLFDLLTTDADLAAVIAGHIDRRRRSPHHPATVAAYRDITTAVGRAWAGRAASRLLREIPESPADVLHTNTLEVLDTHPAGLWRHGDVLVSMRELDTIAVVAPDAGVVRWWWGPGELSGQHQPTMLPNGRILVFDNGTRTRASRLVEVDPVTSTIAWSYTADPPHSWFCPLAGGAEALPESTVLISDAPAGHAYEITRDGQTLWSTRTYNATAERAPFYRMAAVGASTAAAVIPPAPGPATRLARDLLRCELSTPVRSTR